MRRVVALALGLAVLIAAAAANVVRINLSPSMPIGLYRVRHIAHEQAALRRGTIVVVCLPSALATWGRARGYLTRGRCRDGSAPVGKPIFAVSGDTVRVGTGGLTRNREPVSNTSALERDHRGRFLPRLAPGVYPVWRGQLWLVSTRVAESWDSRYYGPVPTTDVIAVLQPMWVR
jgi:conjugative transfer signal peptidase TraF